MSVGEVSRERVEGVLAALDDAYGSFPVNQTTLSVATDSYERARERCRTGLVDAYVRVQNDDDELLLVEDGESLALPHVRLRNGDVPTGGERPGDTDRSDAGERLGAAAARAVDDHTDVSCSVTGLDRVTILGVRPDDGTDRRPVYRLVAVFVGDCAGTTPVEAGSWHADPPASAYPTY